MRKHSLFNFTSLRVVLLLIFSWTLLSGDQKYHPRPLGVFEKPEALPRLAISMLHYLIQSSFIPRTSQLWNTLPSTAFPNPITYHPSNLTSTNWILSLYPLNLPLFSKFFLCRGIVVGPKAFHRHYILKIYICGMKSQGNF